MASRFVVADNDVIEELKTSSENLNTRKSTNVLVEVFKKWAGRAALRNIGEDQRHRNIDNCGGRYSYIRVHRL
jgi:hypothetical protein